MFTTGALRFLIYAGLGIVIGALVALLEFITLDITLGAVLDSPIWVQLILPPIGLVIVYAIISRTAGASSTSSDAYIESFHSGSGAEGKALLPKLIASFGTIGSGGAVGLEGPSILMGATIGQTLGHRIPRVLGEKPRLVLLVAGAAAGVAAIFRAPATGVLWAIEAPYRNDVSRYGLIPALIAAAASYLTFITFLGDEPLLVFNPTELEIRDELLAAVLIGVLAGLVAKGLARGFGYAKSLSRQYEFAVRLPIAAVTMGGALLIANALVDEPVTIGIGSEIAASLVVDNEVTLLAILVLFVLRFFVTGAVLSLGGVGGVFIPLVVQGMFLGRAVEIIVGAPSTGLYPVIGLAAVLGAGYRTPLAAVMFVAETTGRAEFVIPALIATAIAQTMMGSDSVSENQRSARQGQLERRLNEPAASVMIDDLGVITPDATLLDVIDGYGDRSQSFAIPVGGPKYEGLIVLHDLAAAMLEHGPDCGVRQAMRQLPSIRADAPAVEAARLMNTHDTAAIAVVDENDVPVGVISTTSLAGLTSVDFESAD